MHQKHGRFDQGAQVSAEGPSRPTGADERASNRPTKPANPRKHQGAEIVDKYGMQASLALPGMAKHKQQSYNSQLRADGRRTLAISKPRAQIRVPCYTGHILLGMASGSGETHRQLWGCGIGRGSQCSTLPPHPMVVFYSFFGNCARTRGRLHKECPSRDHDALPIRMHRHSLPKAGRVNTATARDITAKS